jgi:hypothetical protein
MSGCKMKNCLRGNNGLVQRQRNFVGKIIKNWDDMGYPPPHCQGATFTWEFKLKKYPFHAVEKSITLFFGP